MYIAFKPEAQEVRWFVSLYFSAPAFAAFLLAILMINITRYTPHAWVISVAGFLLIGYLMLRGLAPYMIVGAH